MKNLCKSGAMLCAVLIFAGCGGNGEDRGSSSGYKVKSQGAPYELMVVADHGVWNGQPGDTIRSIFYKPMPMVSHQETIYDVLRVLPGGFRKLVTKHPNILILNVGKQFDDPGIELHYDVYAAPQIVLTADAPDNDAMVRLLGTRRDEIVQLLEKAERDRDLADARRYGPAPIKNLIKAKFGFDMDVTPGFTVRNDKENFLWISYEMPMSSQGVIIYTYPFSGDVKDFAQESLLRRRDEFTGLIPGENPGSHMSTNPEFIELSYNQIDGRSWSEMHGFWDVTDDFMGGPYTNYSTLDAANQRVIGIDFYVFSPNPRLSQRNYIRQLEHFIYSVRIP